MKRTQNKVSGQRGFSGNRARFRIADLSDEHYVGILAENRAKRCRKRQSTLSHHLHLIDEVKLILNRVLHGRDVATDVLYFVEAGIERCRLAAAGRSSDENDSIGMGKKRAELGDVLLRKAKVIEAVHHRVFAQQTENHFFSVEERQRADADVEYPVRKCKGNTSVLWDGALEHVHGCARL